MDKMRVRDIVKTWMVPTQASSYMAGLEDRPVLVQPCGRTVTDTEGKSYLDFQSGQMGAALVHQHPKMVAAITDILSTMMHASNIMLNVARLTLHKRFTSSSIAQQKDRGDGRHSMTVITRKGRDIIADN